jgi:hypothetical protein
MANNATAYAPIIKFDKQPDGTLLVYGKATDDAIDSDLQICDAGWLDRAMPEWFKTGGNIREQHSNIAAGVATEYEPKADGHYIQALVVDTNSVKKVEAGVLKGFSIGIRAPRVVRDQKAVNGRIIDGQIVEVSLVDRPANPNAKLVLAKSVGADVIQVEELASFPNPASLRKYSDDQERDESGRFGSGGGGSSESSESSSSSSGPSQNAKESAVSSASSEVGGLLESYNEFYDGPMSSEIESNTDMGTDAADWSKDVVVELEEAVYSLGRAEEALAEGEKSEADVHINNAFGNLATANNALSELSYYVNDNLKEATDKFTERINGVADRLAPFVEEGKSAKLGNTNSKESLMASVRQLTRVVKSLKADSVKFDQAAFDGARRALGNLIAAEAAEMATMGHDERQSLSALVEAVSHLYAWYEGESYEGETQGALASIEMADAPDEKKEFPPAKEDEEKALEGEELCAECNKASDVCKCEEGGFVAEEKTLEAEAPVEEEDEEQKADDGLCPDCGEEMKMCKCDDATKSFSAKAIQAVIEKAVKSATEAVQSEILSLKAVSETAEQKVLSLEAELATANKALIPNGPSRMKKVNNDEQYASLSNSYRVKAAATTDPILAKGYAELASEFANKAAGKA